MTIKWWRDEGRLEAGDKVFLCECRVRNEINGDRPLHDPIQVVYSLPAPGKPYMPRPFPKGTWSVGRPLARDDEYKAPFFIPTNAWQAVPIWALDVNGGYDHATDSKVNDYGYGLHSSTSRTTLGCGRVGAVGKRAEILELVQIVNEALDKKEAVWLEVL